MGGELLLTTVEDVSHYWNRLSDGTIIRGFQSRRSRRPAKPNYYGLYAFEWGQLGFGSLAALRNITDAPLAKVST